MKRDAYMIAAVGITSTVTLGLLLGFTQPQDRSRPPRDREHDRTQQTADEQSSPRKQVVDIRINADALRSRLTRSILRSQQLIQRHTEALAKLDAGASATEVLASMRMNTSNRETITDSNQTQISENGQNDRPDHTARKHMPDRLEAKERAEMHRFIEEHLPGLWSNYQPILAHDSTIADRILIRMAPQIREILLLKEIEPELADIKIEEMRAGTKFIDTGRAYRHVLKNASSSEDEKHAAFRSMEAAAAERFDVQLRAKQFEISKLEARLNELKASIGEIEKRRDIEIENMIEATIKPKTRPNRSQGQPANEN